MRGARIKYPSILKLPENAKSISQYAKERKVSVAYVYKLYKKGEINIVDFQGINFVTQ
jgi:hypothetical protein